MSRVDFPGSRLMRYPKANSGSITKLRESALCTRPRAAMRCYHPAGLKVQTADASPTLAAARGREMQLIGRPAASMGRGGVRASRPGGGGSGPDVAQPGKFQARLAPHGHETPRTVQGPL